MGLALSACVPSVEEVVIRCDGGTGEECPTGWHCDTDDVCRSGEAPPAVRWLDPSTDAATTGRATVHFEARCPRGLASASLRIVSPQGLVATLAADPLVTHDEGRLMTFGATWTTWTVEDGLYELEAVAVPSAGPVTPGRATLRIRVANGAPGLAISSPADGAIVDGAIPVAARFSGTVPVTTVEAELQQPPGRSTPGAVDLSCEDEAHLVGSLSAVRDASTLSNGAATVALRVTDLRGRITTTGIPVLVEHAR
jgi:hypothetical protein